jgi:hypothetical protein
VNVVQFARNVAQTGAPEEIRTPDPHIRSLAPPHRAGRDRQRWCGHSADTAFLRPRSIVIKPLILLVGAQGLEPWTR